jgi:formylglycine-generating enzyme required for sulfatase activity
LIRAGSGDFSGEPEGRDCKELLGGLNHLGFMPAVFVQGPSFRPILGLSFARIRSCQMKLCLAWPTINCLYLLRLLPRSAAGLLAVLLGLGLSPASAQPMPAMVPVPGGQFTMGGGPRAPRYEKPRHPVRVDSFRISQHEITLAQYDAFCRATERPLVADRGWGRGRRPAIHVSWYDALRYCNWLSRQQGYEPAYSFSGDTGRAVRCNWQASGFRLPTEAEWAYAAYGGPDGLPYAFAGANEAQRVAWYFTEGAPTPRTHPVGRKAPNELGLYDMSGNVWEWVWDRYAGDYYRRSPVDNPRGPAEGTRRVVRGGSWFSWKYYVRYASRAAERPGYTNSNVGFRVVRRAEPAD